MAQAPAYIMKTYMCLLAFALSVRRGKSHRSLRETVTNFITVIWLITKAAIEIIGRRWGLFPTRSGPRLWTRLAGWSFTERWVTGTFLSSYCCVSGWDAPGSSFNLLWLQVCCLLGFGCTGQRLISARPAWPSCWTWGFRWMGHFCFPGRGAGSLLSVAEGRVATFFKTGTCT